MRPHLPVGTYRISETNSIPLRGKKSVLPFFSLPHYWPWRACRRWEGSRWPRPRRQPWHAWARRRRGTARSSASCRRPPGTEPPRSPKFIRASELRIRIRSDPVLKNQIRILPWLEKIKFSYIFQVKIFLNVWNVWRNSKCQGAIFKIYFKRKDPNQDTFKKILLLDPDPVKKETDS